MSWIPKRFWKSAAVEETQNGFTVRLDGRAVKTPAKAGFALPTLAMAEAAAAEWQAQDEVINPNTMPVTRAANAAIDKVAHQFGEVAEMLAAYGDADLLCYRAEGPEALTHRQALAWDPLLDWAAETFGARLIPAQGVIHQPQRPEALAKLAAPLHDMTPFELTAMHDLVSLPGSLVIGLAAVAQARPVPVLWAASRVDEDWQAEQWGADEEATAHAQLKAESFAAAMRFWRLCQGESLSL